MGGAVTYSNGIGRKDLQTVRRRFKNVHRERLRRIAAELRPTQRIFLELLPLLFHINHPMLPGFNGTTTPVGIPEYTPSKAVLRSARKLSRSFSYQKRARRRYRIQGIYLMGSIGSIAHTTGSDLDIWLCHDPELAPRDLGRLREKAKRIEEWAEELALEVHIFVMDAKSFRQGKREALSHESSGSTHPHLLLEEFYRTGVLLAGRHPVWWLVPPEEERNYSRYVEMLFHKRFVDPLECLDFGGLEEIPASEFLGAAHWQLFKGIESPYKTILKLLLSEAYAQDYPEVHWLSQEAKAAIYEGRIDMDELDPYVLMYRRVEHYLNSRDETARLELARRCFYFKTEQMLSRNSHFIGEEWKRELMQALTREWEWQPALLANLDARDNWKIDHVVEERNILVRELTHSYRLLTDFARTFAASDTIDPQEISLLGRKLYTSMERRPGKIDSINPGISKNLVESSVSLHRARTRGDNNAWQLFLGDIDEDMALVTNPHKTTQGLIEMLVWCHYNRVVNKDTIIHLYPEENGFAEEELQALLGALRNMEPISKHSEVPIEQLSVPPYALSCALFINTGRDPMAHLSKVGMQLTSNRSDPLSFSSAHSSLVKNIEQLMTTSWGETLILSYSGSNGLLESLCHYLRLSLLTRQQHRPPPVSAHSFSSVRGGSIAKRVEQLYNDAASCFSPDGQGLQSRYLLQIDDLYYLIQRQEELFAYFSMSTWEELMEILGEPQKRFRQLTIDQMALNDTPLPEIFRYNQPNIIQLFYCNDKGHTDLYVLDEFGSLFHQHMQGVDEHYLLVQQQRFLSGLRMLRSLMAKQPSHRLLLDAPEFYRLNRDRAGRFQAELRTPPRHQLPDHYMELKLISDSLDLSHAPYYLMCGETEFSSIEHGQQIFTAVAGYILDNRTNHQTYPIYLTSLELSGLVIKESLPTIELLNLKKRLEGRLNQALHQLIRE